MLPGNAFGLAQVPFTPFRLRRDEIVASPAANEPANDEFTSTGVTVIVAVTGAFVALVAVNELMFPTPVAARPIEVLLFVQLYMVAATAPLKVIVAVALLLHTVWSAG